MHIFLERRPSVLDKIDFTISACLGDRTLANGILVLGWQSIHPAIDPVTGVTRVTVSKIDAVSYLTFRCSVEPHVRVHDGFLQLVSLEYHNRPR